MRYLALLLVSPLLLLCTAQGSAQTVDSFNVQTPGQPSTSNACRAQRDRDARASEEQYHAKAQSCGGDPARLYETLADHVAPQIAMVDPYSEHQLARRAPGVGRREP